MQMQVHFARYHRTRDDPDTHRWVPVMRDPGIGRPRYPVPVKPASPKYLHLLPTEVARQSTDNKRFRFSGEVLPSAPPEHQVVEPVVSNNSVVIEPSEDIPSATSLTSNTAAANAAIPVKHNVMIAQSPRPLLTKLLQGFFLEQTCVCVCVCSDLLKLQRH